MLVSFFSLPLCDALASTESFKDIKRQKYFRVCKKRKVDLDPKEISIFESELPETKKGEDFKKSRYLESEIVIDLELEDTDK